jgi:hypothetical protein
LIHQFQELLFCFCSVSSDSIHKEFTMSNAYQKTRRCYLIDHHSPQPPIVPLGKMDIREYKEFFRESGIDSLMVYCKDHWGVTYYDSKVPGAQKHAGVKGDWIRTVRDACAEMGIEFTAYYCIEYDEGAARRFPEWRVQKADGSPLIRDDLYAKWSLNCYNTGYREYALAQLEEIVSGYHPDSLFLDIFGASLCYCPACRKKFEEDYGYPLPETQEGLIAHQKDVKESLDKKAEDFYIEMRDRLKKIDPSLAITINFSCHYPDQIRSLLDYQYSEPLMKDNWYSSAYARDTAVGQYPMLAPGEASQVYNYDSAEQYITDLSSIAAQGCRVGMYSGSQHIDGTLDHEEARRLGSVYRELKKLEPWISQERTPVKGIGILQSDVSKLIPDEDFKADAILRMKKRSPHITAILGAMMACEMAKIPYSILPEHSVSPESLKDYACVIVPEVYTVLPSVKEALSAYAKQGGKLIISGKSGLFGKGAGLPDQDSLADLKGCSFQAVHEEYRQNDWSAYLKAENPEDFQGLLSVTTPPVSEWFIESRPEMAKPLARFLLPAVACSPTEWINWWSPPAGRETEIPAITQNSVGSGSVVYLAFDYFTMVTTEKFRDSYPLFQDVLRLLHVTPAMRNRTEIPEILRTAFFETPDTWQIHQVSTLPDHYHGETISVSGGEIRTVLPVTGAEAVYPEKQTLEVEKDKDEFVIKLPSFRLQQFVVLYK